MGRAKWIVGLALLLGIVDSFPLALTAIDTPASGLALSRQQFRAQFERRRATKQYRNETNREWVRNQSLNDPGSALRPPFSASTTGDRQINRFQSASSGTVPPPPSPGQEIGLTDYDFQAIGSHGHRIARKGEDGANLHFVWMSMSFPSGVDAQQRIVKYARFSDPENYPLMIYNNGTGYNGRYLSGQSNRAGYPSVDVDVSNHAQVGFHQAANDFWTDPYEPWHFWFPDGDDSFQYQSLIGYDNSCPGSSIFVGGVFWPLLAADRGDVTLHEIAHTNINDCPENKLWYWRFDGLSWAGPAFVDNTPDITYALAVDDVGDKVAVVSHRAAGGSTNVYYIESQSDGLDWLTLVPNVDPLPVGSFITNYQSPAPQSAWMHLTATYDNASVLHVMWDEQRDPNTSQAAIKHWNSSRGTIRTATLGYWDNPASNSITNLNLSKLSMGIGDGSTLCQGGAESNNNYVYCIYTQFGGRSAEQLADHSHNADAGYMNGEIYLVASNSGGNTWSSPTNLTNTRTPGCNPGIADVNGDPQFQDSVCRSEHWASINRVVRDIDISFISDVEAGSVIYGEGTWQLNPVHYLEVRGGTTEAPLVCPLIAPVFEATLTDSDYGNYYSYQFGQYEATLTLMNFGGADLTGATSITDFPDAPTLTVTTPGPFTIEPGAADQTQTVTMAANGAVAGLYSGEIVITHNDVTRSSPFVYPIDFYVFNNPCSCPCKFDPQCDGVISDVLDVVAAIGVAFRNDPEATVGNCPITQFDVDANGVTDVTDVVKVINVAFRNQTEAANYVDPCN